MLGRIRKWWGGGFRQTPMEVILKGGEFENVVRPWPVRFARTLRQFYLKNWQWLWGAAIAIVLAAFFGA